MKHQFDDDTNSDEIMKEVMEFMDNPYETRMDQALISKKSTHNAYSVERQFVNTKAFHDKFMKLPLNKEVQQEVYKQTGRLLEFVDNLPEHMKGQERMVAINARTGEFIVDNFERNGDLTRTGFSEKEYEKIKQCEDSLIYIHNHSLNGPPSGQDLLSYLKNDKIRISIIACHDGNIYAIYSVSDVFETIYNEKKETKRIQNIDNDMAKRIVMDELFIINDSLSNKNKLFNIEKL